MAILGIISLKSYYVILSDSNPSNVSNTKAMDTAAAMRMIILWIY